MQGLGFIAEQGVLRYHCILHAVRDEEPVTPDILRVVEPVLPADAGVWVAEELGEEEYDMGFFLDRPISLFVLYTHQGDADRVEPTPGETDTGNVACSRLDVELDPELLAGVQALHEGVNAAECLVE